jgi:hypothetical protein
MASKDNSFALTFLKENQPGRFKRFGRFEEIEAEPH